MKGIVLKGASNTGKTNTLKCLIKLLLNDPAFKLFDCCRDFCAKMQNNVSDVWAKFCYRGIHILITTMGDSPSDTGAFIKKHSLGIDIFICACHDTPHAQQKITQTFKDINVSDVVFVDKKVANDKKNEQVWMPVNEAEALELLDLLKNILQGYNSAGNSHP